MFNTRLKQEVLTLREKLWSLEQVRDSLNQEMLAVYLDPQGRIESANPAFESEMGYRAGELLAAPSTTWSRTTPKAWSSTKNSRMQSGKASTTPVWCG